MLDNLLPGTRLYPNLSNFVCIATDRIAGDNVADIPSSWTDAYWLGWVNYENLPYAYKSFEYTKDANNIIHFTDITKQTNYDVGYGLNSTGNNYPALLKYDENTSLWVGWDRQWTNVSDNSTNMRLLNEFDINQTAVTDIILIFAFNPKLNGVGQSYTMGFLIVPVEDFLNNSFSGTISTANGNLINFAQVSGATLLTSIDITQDDIGGINTQTINGLEVDYFCCGLEVGTANVIDNTGTQMNFSLAVKPLLRMQNSINDDTYISCSYNTPDGFGFQFYCGEGVAYNASAGVIWEWEQNNIANPRPILNGSVVGGNLIGNIDTDVVRNLYGTSGTYGFYYEAPNNFVIQATNSAARMVIRRICNYEDLYKIVSLYPRLSNTNTYDNGSDKWYPYVDANNEFTTQIINGLDDRPKLTTWQLIGQVINPNSSQYEESDKPEYVPSGDDDPGDSGDISFNTNCPVGISSLITQYIMTASQVKTMGTNLWTEISLPNSLVLNNFFRMNNVDSNTVYELTMANIIDYFVSLKYFPFRLDTHVRSHASSGSGIKVGLGTEIINSGTAPQIPDSAMVTLNGGSVYIPTNYGSFLDHEPYTSVSVYVPYCGSLELPASIIRNSTLSLTYSVDLITGSCMAILSKSGDGATFPIATLNGTVGFDVMLTGNNAGTVQANVNNSLNGSLNRTFANSVGLIAGGLSGNPETLAGGLLSTIGNAAKEELNFQNNLPQLAGTSPLTAGTTSCLNALMSPQTAYVQIRYKLPVENGYRIAGGITDKVMKIGATNGMGYIKVLNPRLDGLKCTGEEINMIKSALQAGIFT